METATPVLTYCVFCDASPGDCNHTGARYLDHVYYERVLNDLGETIGWKVPPYERQRFDGGSRYPGTTSGGATDVATQTHVAKPIQDLVAKLDQWLFLDDQLEQRFRDYYDENAVRATRLALHVVAGAESGSLRNPDGFLASRLRKK